MLKQTQTYKTMWQLLPSCVSISSSSLSGVGGSVMWFILVKEESLSEIELSLGKESVAMNRVPRGSPPPPAPVKVCFPFLLPFSRPPVEPFLPDAGTLRACLLAIRPMSASYQITPKLRGTWLLIYNKSQIFLMITLRIKFQ